MRPGPATPVDPALVTYCDDLRARIGMPDEIMFALLGDIASAVTRVLAMSTSCRHHHYGKALTDPILEDCA